MNIEHKTTPIEHWIVDGKAYRLATEKDVGKEAYFDDTGIEMAFSDIHVIKLHSVQNGEFPFRTGTKSAGWKYAYVQDDSLLTPQRTPVPALGDGWFLLRDDEVLQIGDKVTAVGLHAAGSWVLTASIGMPVKDWRRGVERYLCARYFGPTEGTEIKPGPTEEPPTKPIDWTKPVRTKSRHPVRILCTDGPCTNYPVIGIIENTIETLSWTLDGTHSIGHPGNLDLENVPQRIQREEWVNVYVGYCTIHSTKELADSHAKPGRFAICKHTIDCEEGEGL